MGKNSPDRGLQRRNEKGEGAVYSVIFQETAEAEKTITKERTYNEVAKRGCLRTNAL